MKMKFKYSVGELASRLIKLARPQAGHIVAATIASIVGNLSHMGLMGFGAAMLLSACGRLEQGSPLSWGIHALVCGILIGLMRFVEGVESHVAAYNLLADMRVRLYRSLRRLAPACMIDKPKGDLLSVAIADIETIENFFAHTIGPIFTVVLLPLTALICAFRVHPRFALALLPLYIIISVIIPAIAMKTGRGIGMRYRAGIGALKSHVLETIYGLKDIQIFGLRARRMEETEQRIKSINRSAHALALHRQLVQAMPAFVISLSRIMIVYIALSLSSRDANMAGTVILSFVVSASFSSTQSLITVVSSLLEAFSAAERYFSLEDELPAVSECEAPEELSHIGELAFRDVNFRYGKDSETILEHMNIAFSQGEKIGIVGESGSGKSTITRLMLRFWDPESGAVTADGRDIRGFRLRDLRGRIALMEQSTFLFNDTIAANIAYGKPDASMEEIREAARKVGLDRVIERLPDGYETQMGEQGNRLSGGEKQRVGIARTLLIDPDILIMDEPSSNLDVFNEKLLLKTLEDVYPDKTVIIVSHRLTTLMGCDRILRLENGKLEA